LPTLSFLVPSPLHNNEANEDWEDFVFGVTEQGYGKGVSTNLSRKAWGDCHVVQQINEEVKEDKMSCFALLRNMMKSWLINPGESCYDKRCNKFHVKSRPPLEWSFKWLTNQTLISSVSVLPMTEDDA
jgi:hypothetical protein